MKSITDETVGSMVADDYRVSKVFSRYGIDFCCKGGKTMAEACAQRHLDPGMVAEEIAQLKSGSLLPEHPYKEWEANNLADYIESKHHQYVRAHIPLLTAYLDKLCRVHGTLHPELFTIRELFNESAEELKAHMLKEEQVLFPYVRKMMLAKRGSTMMEPVRFLNEAHPLNVLMYEHDVEGERFRKIAELSDGYNPPPTACITYRVAFSMLKEFEEDLHLHIHLENNLLFPKSIAIENELFSKN